MWRETNLFGILMSPFVAYAFAAALIYVPIRILAAKGSVFRWVWNQPLAEAGIYMWILGTLVVWF